MVVTEKTEMKKIRRMKNSLAAQQNLFLHLLPNQRSFYLFLSLPTPFISLLLPSPSRSSGREPGTGPRVSPSPDCTDCVSSDWPIRGLFLLQLVVFSSGDELGGVRLLVFGWLIDILQGNQ